MRRTAAVALVDARGRLLLQERDERAPVDPEKWSLVGGGIEEGESDAEAALRELEEETGLSGVALDSLGVLTFYCDGCHESHEVALFTAFTDLTDADVDCHEGRQIVFVDPTTIDRLDWNRGLAVALPHIVGNPAYADRFGARERHEFGCVLLVDDQGGVLLQERDEGAPIDPDRWGLAGGHLEPGEDAEQGAYRELRRRPGSGSSRARSSTSRRSGSSTRTTARSTGCTSSPHASPSPTPTSSATRVARSSSCRRPAPATSTSP